MGIVPAARAGEILRAARAKPAEEASRSLGDREAARRSRTDAVLKAQGHEEAGPVR
ncbi:hypothetical protein [Streptomyces sp. NRRL S-340]|uniref:hypothetical protein n=1 Tax=Streptomyces sp. NRRL S-340 TaxID=1463901 RepID=UPI000A88C3C8|nr:hypothetical protein [Streptomyces sp. NRRL S-340]